jgi:monothiol glutaredoxin
MDSKVEERIKSEIEANPIILFMKGNKEAPQCGFSAQVVQILNSYGVDYKTIDILADYDLREGIKEYSSWPTIPQLYVRGEFVGGCDISMELHRKGKMKDILDSAKS